jgi:hypothetical protein
MVDDDFVLTRGLQQQKQHDENSSRNLSRNLSNMTRTQKGKLISFEIRNKRKRIKYLFFFLLTTHNIINNRIDG